MTSSKKEKEESKTIENIDQKIDLFIKGRGFLGEHLSRTKVASHISIQEERQRIWEEACKNAHMEKIALISKQDLEKILFGEEKE